MGMGAALLGCIGRQGSLSGCTKVAAVAAAQLRSNMQAQFYLKCPMPPAFP